MIGRHRLRAGSRSAVCLLLLLLLGCVRSDKDEVLQVVREYERLRVEGDLWSLTELLVDQDAAVFGEGYRHHAFAGLRMSPTGIIGGRLDSVRLLSLAQDTARAVAYVSDPTWSSRWHEAVRQRTPSIEPVPFPDQETQRQREKHRAARWRAVSLLRDSLPLDVEADTLTLVRQGGRWRIFLDLVNRERVRKLEGRILYGDAGYAAASNPMEQKIDRARDFLHVAARYPSYADSGNVARARAMVQLEPYLDSLRVVDVKLQTSGPNARALVVLENRSARGFRLITVDVVVPGAGWHQGVRFRSMPPRSVRRSSQLLATGADSIAGAYLSWLVPTER